MQANNGERGSGRLGCIVWLAILCLIGYGLYKIIPVKVATSTFYDFMQEEASFASIRDVKQLQKEILAKAKELELPVTEDNLTIKRSKEAVRIEAHYEITIEFFNGWKKYVWKFDQVVDRPTFLV
jgi:hypothetical protein